jgi:hypothetical protein
MLVLYCWNEFCGVKWCLTKVTCDSFHASYFVGTQWGCKLAIIDYCGSMLGASTCSISSSWGCDCSCSYTTSIIGYSCITYYICLLKPFVATLVILKTQ